MSTPHLPPESEDNGIEYKYFVRGDRSYLENIKTQMCRRLRRGGGTATYWVGVMDDGRKVGISEPFFSESLKHLNCIVSELSAAVVQIEHEVIESPPPPMHSCLEYLAPLGKPRWVARMVVVKPDFPFSSMLFDLPTTPPRRANIMSFYT